ncbi:hypothetical protein B0T26DRAFT_638468 [Lasiosphaeria miniovina]|uniref:CRAL-TRIO domain-containing protein n=1 Tax=Lasiosphaeria miniovina TaxID=1954250 RepID=A0AA40B5Q5_9PEZI|nr:uncharacterized protein B0T26DRAFT_638468 [Lasiosphaeria miniovina]KAK0727853.1 hypothetical protein B0T26DRAFT_638468 [Lasiosphaeria miniovina]
MATAGAASQAPPAKVSPTEDAVEVHEKATSSVLKVPLESPTPESHPGERSALTADQQAKLDWLLAKVKTWTEIPSTKGKAGPLTDNDRFWLTRDCLLRYLRATKWHEKESEKRLLATLTWRREYGVDDLTFDHISPENETGKQVLLGYDNQCRPCHYLFPGRQNTPASPRQVQHLVFMVERVIDLMPPQQEALSLLIDFTPSKTRSYTAPGLGIAREVLSILQNHYPERLGKALIVHTPWAINVFFKLISPFIDPHTKEKLKFNDDMTKYVPAEQLVTEFKGNLEFEYNHASYWPALQELCRKKHDARWQRWVAGGQQIFELEDYLTGHLEVVTTPGAFPVITMSAAASTTTTTKAWAYTKRGLPRAALQLTTTHPLPAAFPPPGPAAAEEWLLIRVSYAALNPGDAVVMAFLPAVFRSAKTTVPCYDLVGTVLDVWTPPPPSSSSPSTTPTPAPAAPALRFRPGDTAIGFLVVAHMLRSGSGALQGTVALPAKYAVRLPSNRVPRDAAGLLLTACTAAEMITAATPAPAEAKLRRVVDYTQHANLADELARRYGQFDAVIDAFGDQALYKSCARILKPGGVYSAAGVHSATFSLWAVLKVGLTLAANALWPRTKWLGGTGRTWKAASMMDPGVELMERVVGLLGEGKLRVAVDSEWPFDKALDAFDVLLSGRARGKILIKVNDDE